MFSVICLIRGSNLVEGTDVFFFKLFLNEISQLVNHNFIKAIRNGHLPQYLHILFYTFKLLR